MTGPKRATTSRATGQRFYTWRDEAFWSVTTIIGGGVPKPALINWAKKFTAEYAIDNYDKFQALMAPDANGVIDREAVVQWLKDAAFRDRDKKADLGTAIHAATEAHILGKPQPEWPPVLRPRMDAFLRYLADYEPEILMAEASVYNRAQSYAGTLDAIEVVKGRTILRDTKTGKGVYPEYALQLSAYAHAEFVGAADGSEQPLPEIDAAAVLHLADDGDYELVEVRADQEVFRAFLYAREVFRWCTETSKSVLLGPVPKDEPTEAQLALAAEMTKGA